jgi:hypothetical protein
MLLNILRTMLMALRSSVRSRAGLELQNVALRHQICVFQCSAKKRLRLTPADRLFWVVLSRIDRVAWGVGHRLPETVIAWHRKGFRLFWTVLVQTGPIADDGRMQPFSPVEALFKGRHFDGQIIILCVSWYTSFKLSLRDLVIMMADRGIPLTHTTILRWVQHYLPEFEKRWSRYARPVGGSWRMDETS